MFDISTFLLPIEVDFPERTENQASGIFGLVRDSHVYKGNYAKHHCKFVFSKFLKFCLVIRGIPVKNTPP